MENGELLNNMSLSKEEKETIITYDESNNIAEIYTCSQNIIKKLDKLCEKYPDQYKIKNEDNISKTYITSKKLIKFSPLLHGLSTLFSNLVKNTKRIKRLSVI